MPLFVEDLVRLRSSSSWIGQIDRTSSDVSSHTPDPVRDYHQPIQKGSKISHQAFRTFLRTGVPPRGTVLVAWVILPWQEDLDPVLIRETELNLVDRSLLAGDIVKKDLADPMSGTVVETTTVTSLIQPAAWPVATSRPVAPNDGEDKFGNYLLEPGDMVHGISTQDLRPPVDFESGRFVIYKGSIGKVAESWDDVYIRLGNGSVVAVSGSNELEISDLRAEDETPVVGDFVRTKKAVLRRGRWIYGSYDANIEPAGFIADTRPTSIQVDWLFTLTDAVGPSQPPPFELDADDLASGQVISVDRTHSPPSARGTDTVKLDMDVCVGDTVRFRDIISAESKYNSRKAQAEDASGLLQRQDRSQSLGYDINVFMVALTHTTVKVLWQDQTISTLPSINLVRYLDMIETGDIWPGDLVATHTNPEPGQDVIQPKRVGIVQHANASSRIAKVRWFTDPHVLYTTSELDSVPLLPGSYTGDLGVGVEDVSFYEVEPIPGLERRLGDFVCLVQTDAQRTESIRPELESYHTILASKALLANTRNMFGEIIDLGLDGLLTVRLIGAEPVRDIRIPWEGSFIVASSDAEDGASDAMDYEDEFDYGIDSDIELSSDDESEDARRPWFDGDGNIIDDDEGGWETDGEEIVSEDDADTSDIAAAPAENNKAVSAGQDDAADDIVMTEGVKEAQSTSRQYQSHDRSTFSYATMFSASEDAPASFAVLDTAVPSNHAYFHEQSASLSGARLRRIQKEHGILQSSLPAGLYVRTFESRLDLLRVLILGPLDTPYEYAPFVIDFWMDPGFPHEPPRAFFHSWTNGSGPVNPNLYEDGKICLSLLGTWPGDDHNDTWSEKSTILQILVSLLGLVLVKDPYYNEAGYESRVGTVEAKIPAALYAERTFFKTRAFIHYALTKGIQGFDEELRQLFYRPQASAGETPQLLRRALAEAMRLIRYSEDESISGAGPKLSAGALIPLKRQVDALWVLLEKEDCDSAALLPSPCRQ